MTLKSLIQDFARTLSLRLCPQLCSDLSLFIFLKGAVFSLDEVICSPVSPRGVGAAGSVPGVLLCDTHQVLLVDYVGVLAAALFILCYPNIVQSLAIYKEQAALIMAVGR